LPEVLKTLRRFNHISFREQEVHVPEGEPICEKENPLQYKVHHEARQLEILVEVDVHTSWQNDRFFDIGVMSYYRCPPHGLHEALLKHAPLVTYAPAEPRLLYALQTLRPPLGNSVNLWQSFDWEGVPVSYTHPAYSAFHLASSK